jgi:two-component system cell cycle response regulator
MSLKVLLADESSTIKKAFQLSLGEFAADIKTVPSGLDVISVALDFHPDIIFADILLGKKNGYDVCAEVKNHPKLKTTPVILMWSSFMDFNTVLAEKSGANDKLEKPFDAQNLKDLAKKFVSKLTYHPLDGLLVNPRLPDFTESETFVRQRSAIESQAQESTKMINIDADEFQPVKLNPKDLAQPTISARGSNAESALNQKSPDRKSGAEDLDHIRIETESFGEFEEVVLIKADQELDELEEQIGKNIKDYLGDTGSYKTNSMGTPSNNSKKSRFDEQMMREEIKMLTEKICWQIIPEIAERIVREEIQKLMKNIEKSI